MNGVSHSGDYSSPESSRQCADLVRKHPLSGANETPHRLPDKRTRWETVELPRKIEKRNPVKTKIITWESSLGNHLQGNKRTQPPGNRPTTQHGASRLVGKAHQ